MKSDCIRKLKWIAEKAFDLDDISIPLRKKRYINARAWFYKACRDIDEICSITYQEAGEAMNRDHATALHAVNTYPSYVRFDRFKRCHADADVMLDRPFNPIEWRDRYIDRLKKIIKTYQKQSRDGEETENVHGQSQRPARESGQGEQSSEPNVATERPLVAGAVVQ
jgi:hypothetical protein